ncbi:MAG: hypothetical protein ACMUEM_04205 [Flavobacteriales bacterium AspAUS03]
MIVNLLKGIIRHASIKKSDRQPHELNKKYEIKKILIRVLKCKRIQLLINSILIYSKKSIN